MSRLAQRFERLARDGRTALIPFVTAGDPSREATVPVLLAMAAAGADVLEIGVPFSDPMADGPVIQQAGERALARGTTLAAVLQVVREVRAADDATPVVLMGYANPIERHDQRHGDGAFVRDAVAAGVDGVLVVDYPPEACEPFAAACRAAGLDLIFLVAPTSTDARIAQVGRLASGYVYHVSLTGVTGAGHLDVNAVAQALPRVRRHVRVPVGVGFGIRDGATARRIAAHADAVVIGSRLVQAMHDAHGRDGDNGAVRAAADFIAEVRAALDAPAPDAAGAPPKESA